MGSLWKGTKHSPGRSLTYQQYPCPYGKEQSILQPRQKKVKQKKNKFMLPVGKIFEHNQQV